MATSKALALPVIVLAIAVLACRMGPETPLPSLFPSPTGESTQTPIIVQVRETVVVQITTTPKPTATRQVEKGLCISATEAVWLRPSPGIENYPVVELERGQEVTDLGGRDGSWIFVSAGDKRGWINQKYVSDCK